MTLIKICAGFIILTFALSTYYKYQLKSELAKLGILDVFVSLFTLEHILPIKGKILNTLDEKTLSLAKKSNVLLYLFYICSVLFFVVVYFLFKSGFPWKN